MINIMRKTLDKSLDDKYSNNFLFEHLKKKILKKNYSADKEEEWIKTVIKAFKKNTKILENCLKKRKKRTFIDPKWEIWIKKNKKFVSENSFNRILKRMKVAKERKGWCQVKLPTRFMVNNRKRTLKKL